MVCRDCWIWQQRRDRLVGIYQDTIPQVARLCSGENLKRIAPAAYSLVIRAGREVRDLDLVRSELCPDRCRLLAKI